MDTKKAIAQNFKKLLCKEPMEKITVKEIAEATGIIRPTFYNHFTDKYEILEYIINKEILEPVRPLLINDMIAEAYTLIFSNLKNESEFYKNAVKIEGQNSFESIAVNQVAIALEDAMNFLYPEKHFRYSWVTRDMVARYYAKNMCYVVITWIQRGFEVSPKELSEIYQYMSNHSMIDIFSELV